MKKLVLLMLVASILLTGCYFNEEIQQTETGAQLDKNLIHQCVGPGVYTDMGWWADLQKYSVTTLTFSVEDPEVATKDNQLVGVKITIQAQRKADCDSTRLLLTNWNRLRDDSSLVETITATAREGIKNGTRGFTLTDLLNDRNGLASSITTYLEEDAGKYATAIINVTIENVAIAPSYAEVLQKTAQLKAEEDFQLRRQALVQQQAQTDLFEKQQAQLVLAEQLKVEEAKTLVEVEIARREGEKIAAAYEVYRTNPQAFDLRRLELMKDLFGDKTVYFIPEGTDLTTIFGLHGMTPLGGN